MEELSNIVKRFIASKIDEIVANNPMMATISSRIKRGINAMIDEKMSDNTFINAFLLNDEGKLDANLYDEVSKIFDEMPLQNMDVMNGLADISIGRGRVELHVHKNAITSFLMPNSGKITLTKDDLKEFFDMATKK